MPEQKRRFRRKRQAHDGTPFGRHRAIIGGKRILVNPGDTVHCYTWELGPNWAESYDALDPEVIVPPNTYLRMKPKGGGWYDVVNTETGRAINTRSLRHAEAVELIPADHILPPEIGDGDVPSTGPGAPDTDDGEAFDDGENEDFCAKATTGERYDA